MDTAKRAAAHERRWDGTLAACPAWCPKDGDLLVVAAHPDDEVRGAGGLMRAWVTRGSTVRVLSVSDGEAEDPRCRPLASGRREELNEALRKLCPTHVAVTRLGIPLGRISQHVNRLRNALLSLAGGEVTLIAPHDRAGHPDHEAVGSACVDFARARRVPLARYGIGQYGIGPGRQPPAPGSEGRWVKFLLSEEVRRAKARAVQCFRARGDSRPGRALTSPQAAQAPEERPYEAFLL